MGDAWLPNGRPGEPQLRQASRDRAEGDLPFQLGQRGTEAEMDAIAQSDVAIGLAGDIEGVRLGKLGWVPIGRRERRGHDLAGRNRQAGQLDISRGEAPGSRKRRIEPEDLIDRRARQQGCAAAQLSGMAQERRRLRCR